jgi:hypothetical protein
MNARQAWLRLQREDKRPWLLLCAVMAEARQQSRSSGPMQQRHFNTTVAIALRPMLQETVMKPSARRL